MNIMMMATQKNELNLAGKVVGDDDDDDDDCDDDDDPDPDHHRHDHDHAHHGGNYTGG